MQPSGQWQWESPGIGKSSEQEDKRLMDLLRATEEVPPVRSRTCQPWGGASLQGAFFLGFRLFLCQFQAHKLGACYSLKTR